jgi:hypothetical protein
VLGLKDSLGLFDTEGFVLGLGDPLGSRDKDGVVLGISGGSCLSSSPAPLEGFSVWKAKL